MRLISRLLSYYSESSYGSASDSIPLKLAFYQQRNYFAPRSDLSGHPLCLGQHDDNCPLVVTDRKVS